MENDKILATHTCKESKKANALIRFMPKWQMDGVEKSAWHLGGHVYDLEYDWEYEKNYFKIKSCPFCGEVLPPVDIPVIPKEELLFQEPVKLHPNGCNANLRVHLLPEPQMRSIGFTDYSGTSWSYFRKLNKEFDISFSLSIPKDNPAGWRLNVLDEDFCQPYDYQNMLRKNPRSKIPITIRDEVEKVMSYLMEKGVLSGHVKGAYI